MERHCPRCFLPESEMDTCVNKSFGPQFQCPPAEESDPHKTAHIHCGPCGKDLIVPIGTIMRGKMPTGSCVSDKCQAKLLTEFRSPAAEAIAMDAAPFKAPFVPGEITQLIEDTDPPAPTPDATEASTPSKKAKAPTPQARGGK